MLQEPPGIFACQAQGIDEWRGVHRRLTDSGPSRTRGILRRCPFVPGRRKESKWANDPSRGAPRLILDGALRLSRKVLAPEQPNRWNANSFTIQRVSRVYQQSTCRSSAYICKFLRLSRR